MQKRRVLAAWSFALASSTPALAQLAPPNDMGVALGHIHVVAFLTDPWGTYIEVTEGLAP